jgi:hypothetical protein
MRARRIGRWLVAASCLIAGLVPRVVAAQCAMCGTAMGSRGGFARGFTISVLFLLSTLILVVAGFVRLVVVQSIGRDQGRADADSRQSLPARPVEAGGGRWRSFLRRVFFL